MLMKKDKSIAESPIGPELIGELFDRHAKVLVLYARQLCSDPTDVVQQAFVKLAQLRTKPTDSLAWLYRVVRNEALMQSRSSKRRKLRESEVALDKAQWFVSCNDNLTDLKAATDALDQLPEELREVVVARIWGELSFEQIGQLMGMSASSAFRRYQEALEKLKTKIGGSCKNTI
jgi:RNA polymerase sigma factor (sigma-70 family)